MTEEKKREFKKPKKFETKEELTDLFIEFIEAIRTGEYDYIPSQTSFCLWLRETGKMNVDRRTIYNTVNKYFPDIKRKMNDLQAETMVEGGMKGKYVPSMTIFALKNWFGYRDKIDTEITGSINTGVSNMEKVIDQLMEK